MSKGVLELVKARLASSGGELAKRVENVLFDKEMVSRQGILLDAVAKAEILAKAVSKIKPDMVQYTEDGKVASCTYSKVKLDERKRIVEGLDKLNKAIDKIVVDNGGDFEGLKKLASIVVKVEADKPESDAT